MYQAAACSVDILWRTWRVKANNFSRVALQISALNYEWYFQYFAITRCGAPTLAHLCRLNKPAALHRRRLKSWRRRITRSIKLKWKWRVCIRANDDNWWMLNYYGEAMATSMRLLNAHNKLQVWSLARNSYLESRVIENALISTSLKLTDYCIIVCFLSDN